MFYFTILVLVLFLGLGMSAWVASDSYEKGQVFTIGLIVTAVVLGLVTLGFSATQVDFAEIGAISIFGELQDEMLEPGFHMVKPWSVVTKMPNRFLTYQTTEYVDTSKAEYADFPVTTNTSDGQVITVEFNLNFKVNDPSLVLRSFGDFDNMVSQAIVPKARSYTRNAARAFTAEQLQHKETVLEYTQVTFDELKNELSRFGIIVDSLEIRDIGFDPDYLAAIEAQQIAEEAIETRMYEAQQEEYKAQGLITAEKGRAEQAVIKAEADAKVQLINAQAEADAKVLLAEAEAKAIYLQGEALRNNPSMISWEFVKNWAEGIDWGILPSDVLPLMQIIR